MSDSTLVDYRPFFESSPWPMWIVEPGSGRILDVNDAAVRRYGFGREQFAAMTLDQVAAEDEERRLECSAERGGVLGLWRHRRADGSQLWAEVLCQPVPFGGGEAWLVLAHDISGQVDAERALRRSEARFHSFIENAADVITVLDGRGVIVYESPSAARALGYSPEEMVGRSALEFIHPDDLPRTRAALAAALADPGGTHALEYRMRHGDGSWRAREATGCNLLHVPEVAGFVINSRDVTERKDAEEALRCAEERLRFALKASGTGVWDWTLDGASSTWSEEMYRLHGLDPCERPPMGDAYFRMVHPDDRAGVMDSVERAIRENREYRREFRVIWPDGSVHWLEGRARVFPAAGQGAARMVGTAIDITERKSVEAERVELLARERAARAEAERASQAKTTFLAIVSHELRTPLASIISFAELLQEEVGGPLAALHRQHVDRILGSAWHLTQLVGDILDFSRVDAGQGELRPERFDVAQAVREVVQEIAPQAAAKGLDLRFDEPPEPVPVETDRTRYRQIVLNLLSNALKFTREGGIGVDLARDAGSVRLRVSDSGIGIAPEDLERIFEPFWQVESPMTRHAGGTGLGLSIAQRLARFLSGELTVSSVWGEGSVFTLSIPCAPPPGAPERGGAHGS